MPRRFQQFRFDEETVTRLRAETFRGRPRSPFELPKSALGTEAGDVGLGGNDVLMSPPNDETAARVYLARLFAPREENDVLLTSISAPDRPAIVPDLRVNTIRRTAGPRRPARENVRGRPELERPSATLVSFVQTSGNVPIFGSHAHVTLDLNRALLAASAQVAPPPTVSPIARMSVAEALARVADAAFVSSASLSGADSPHLEFFDDDATDRWHLVFHFARLPAIPLDTKASSLDRELAASPRSDLPQYDWLVDANDGSIVFTYCSNPTLTPTKCSGVDESGQTSEFLAVVDGSGYEMYDPLRSIRTFDLAYGDIMTSSFPPKGITSSTTKPWGTDKGAISAHVNATRVQQFYYDVLGRHSIDDKGMELVSVVNCTYQSGGQKSWPNAVWYNHRMWYGQMPDASGALRSFARYLDIIGHELTHGVTETTAALVYKDLSGALNESFSDIFGIIIYNWELKGTDSDVSNWSWTIGDGLAAGGKPFRDMQDPTRLGHPREFKNRVTGSADNGGVHTNSSIHNYAAYRLLDTGSPGARPVSGRDAAVLYYSALQNLGPMADFSDARKALEDAARVYFGDPGERSAALTAIADAYDAAGIV